MNDVTEDGFLDGRVTAAQPKKGFRAGHDTVLLAAAVPAKTGERVLELGSGAGIASLCLAARVTDCDITGIEIDGELVALANANAAANGMGGRVRFVQGDVFAAVPEGAPFGHAFLNPPFHDERGQVSPSVQRDRATRGEIVSWLKRALELVKDHGTVTAILRADRLNEIEPIAKDARLSVLLLLPSADPRKSPKRVIVQAHKGEKGGRSVSWLVLHEDDGSPTKAADAVLRHAGPLAVG